MMLAKQSCTECVERANRHSAADSERLNPLAHLPGSLISERDRQNVVRSGYGSRQMGGPSRHHTGLAAPWTGEDQQRPIGVGDGLPLRIAQARKEVSNHRFPTAFHRSLYSLSTPKRPQSTTTSQRAFSLIRAPSASTGFLTPPVFCSS